MSGTIVDEVESAQVRSPRRLAELVVCVGDEEFERLGEIPFAAESRHKNSGPGRTLVVGRNELRPDAASVLLEEVWVSSTQLREALDRCGITPERCILRVVAYIGATDEIGPGIPIDQRWVAFLSRMGRRGSNVFVDLDIYHRPTGG